MYILNLLKHRKNDSLAGGGGASERRTGLSELLSDVCHLLVHSSSLIFFTTTFTNFTDEIF